MKKASIKKMTRVHDDFFMRMAEACSQVSQGDGKAGDFEAQNESILETWLEYNAAHGKKASKRNTGKKYGK